MIEGGICALAAHVRAPEAQPRRRARGRCEDSRSRDETPRAAQRRFATLADALER